MFRIVSILSVLGVLGAAAAQAQSGHFFRAQVPFAFQVGQKTFAAGTYRLSFDPLAGILLLRNAEQPTDAAYVLASASTESNSANGALVFRCHAKACYLAEVRQGPFYGGSVLQLPESGAERSLSFMTRTVSFGIPGR